MYSKSNQDSQSRLDPDCCPCVRGLRGAQLPGVKECDVLQLWAGGPLLQWMCSTQEAPCVNGCMLNGHAKANFPGTQDAFHVDGCTLEGQIKANQVHHSQEVLVVSPSSSYYVGGWVGKKPAQVLIDCDQL